MVLANLAYALVALAICAAVLSLAHDQAEGFLLTIGPVVVFAAWTQALAWLELRRRQDASST
jgi:hypothetical protein